jgi:hypothetical protein
VINAETANTRFTASTALKGTWRLDRKLSGLANSEDVDAAEEEGTLARGLDEVRFVLESKGHTNTPLAISPPRNRTLISSAELGVIVDSTFYD